VPAYKFVRRVILPIEGDVLATAFTDAIIRRNGPHEVELSTANGASPGGRLRLCGLAQKLDHRTHFAWISRRRRSAISYEQRLEHGEAIVYLRMLALMIKRRAKQQC
jgi:hypothetical protein